MSGISKRDLYGWCRVPYDELENHPRLRIPFRVCTDAVEMGQLMARELAEKIAANNAAGRQDAGPSSPAGHRAGTALHRPRQRPGRRPPWAFVVFHMDECLDWQGRELPRAHPYSFRGFMERHFYDPVDPALAVPEEQRHWLAPATVETVREAICRRPPSTSPTAAGGRTAMSPTTRRAGIPTARIGLDDLRASTIRVQENNWDTVLALAQRTFGTAYQFVPPMSVTLGMRSASRRGRSACSATPAPGSRPRCAWRCSAPPTPEYPITLLGEHPDALITATVETATHPITEHPEWDLGTRTERHPARPARDPLATRR